MPRRCAHLVANASEATISDTAPSVTCEQRDRARRAGRFVAARRQAGKRRVGVDEERAEMPLHRIQLGGEVADVPDLDLVWLDAGGCQAALHGLANQRGDVLALFGPVA